MATLELIAFGGWCFAIALAGGLVGLVLGNMRLPMAVAIATSPAAGAGANIGISGLAAAAAAITHIRAGRMHWPLVAVMAPPSIVGALAGGYLSGLLPDRLLLAVIGVTLLYFGADLLRRREQRPHPAAGPGRDGRGQAPNYAAAAIAGGFIGLLGGLVGLILGSLRMPALLRYVGADPARAVGTNITVGVCVGAAGVVGHLPAGVDWRLLAVGAAVSIPGAVLGARFTGRLSEAQLLRVIGGVLVLAGASTLAQAAI